MKKLLLSVLMLAGFAAFAQKDISVTINTPAAGDTIRNKMPFSITYTVTNNGPALTTADTIIIFFTINNNLLQGQNGPVAQLIRQDVATGGTVNGTLNGVSLTAGSGGPGPVSICVIGFHDEDTSNVNGNQSCATAQLAFSSGASELEAAASTVKVFPNPVSDVLNFNIEYNKASQVRIMDITGRLIESASFNMNAAQVDVRSFKSGIYMYQILNTEGETVKAGKFTVNN